MKRLGHGSRWTLVAVLCSGAAFAQDKPATTPAIAGVVAAGTAIELVKEGFNGTEGPLPQQDGGILFTENRAGQIVRVAPDGTTSVWLAASGGANALALNPQGEIFAALTEKPAIGVLKAGAAPRVLVQEFEGKPFNRPNDLTAGRLGQVYFTDPGVNGAAGEAPPPSAVYHLGADGKLARIANDIRRPNGIALSPDENRLYVANTAGEWVIAFDLDATGKVKARKDFAKLTGLTQGDNGLTGGADGLAVDEAGRLYAATAAGVQVFSSRGEPLVIIVLPKASQNLAFAGKDRSTLYVVGRGSVYRIATQTRGPQRAGK